MTFIITINMKNMLGKKSLKTLFATLFLAISTITNATDTTPVSTKYLSNVPQYISYEKGELLSDCEVSGGDGALKLLSVENEDITDDGVMAYISFKVKDGASGDCAVKIVCDENSVCNYDEESIAVETSDGKVTVK